MKNIQLKTSGKNHTKTISKFEDEKALLEDTMLNPNDKVLELLSDGIKLSFKEVDTIHDLKLYLKGEKLSLDDWIHSLDLSDEDEEDKLRDSIIQDSLNDGDFISEVYKGFDHQEDVKNAYFSEGVYEPVATVVEYKYKEHTVYILIDTVGVCDVETYFTIYKDKVQALKDMRELEGTGYPSIEKQIASFNKKIGDYDIVVKVKEEYLMPHGYFYSFNLYLDGELLVDTLFKLDAEEVLKQIEGMESIKKYLEENNLSLDSIKKTRSNFERYYEIEIGMKGSCYTVEREIHIPCYFQGQQKNIADFLRTELDIDDILEEFKELA